MTDESRHAGDAPQQGSIQRLEARITELENKLKRLQQPAAAQLSQQDVEAFMRVRDALEGAMRPCVGGPCTRCIARCFGSCITNCIGTCVVHCLGRCLGMADVADCSCGPCVVSQHPVAGGLDRFGGLGG